tara:strand:- start:2138 stop:2938 length:801 start_codon:yes stop_codon:yes gene_type:complete
MNEPKKKFQIVTDKSARVILPNTLTLIGVCIGLSSINFALNQNYQLAIIAILCAAIIDGLDGRIARLIKGTSKVGKELDSLTDIISFGVAPAFIMYFWSLSSLGKIGWLVSLIYVVCVALRLARFNINTGGESSWRDNFFEGIPSPAGGILVLSPLVYEQSGINLLNLDFKSITPYLFIVVSIFLISKMPTYSFKKIIVPRSMTIFLLLGIVLLFGLLLIFPFQVIFLGSIIYLLAVPISILHYKKLKKGLTANNQLKDDEPEDML